MNKIDIVIPIFILIGSVWRFFRAEKSLYGNEELFIHTPEYDVENVKKKHRKIWLCLFAFSFFPLALIAVEVLFALLASESVYEAYKIIVMPPSFVILATVWILSANKYGWITKELKEQGKTVGRYMVYPGIGFLATQIAALLLTVVVFVCSVIFVLLPIEMKEIDTTELVIVFAEALFLADFANYAVLSWYNNTPREVVLNDLPEADYDKAARRYYGIWRNRLLLANLIAGAQLILGGFVTMTESGDHLMTLRI
ncbi:MAG: hypothetical protein IKU25_03455, partial [Clostridia bacterium]|nr:hypothetical protein [Clostridia bacterium]